MKIMITSADGAVDALQTLMLGVERHDSSVDPVELHGEMHAKFQQPLQFSWGRAAIFIPIPLLYYTILYYTTLYYTML